MINSIISSVVFVNGYYAYTLLTFEGINHASCGKVSPDISTTYMQNTNCDYLFRTTLFGRESNRALQQETTQPSLCTCVLKGHRAHDCEYLVLVVVLVLEFVVVDIVDVLVDSTM